MNIQVMFTFLVLNWVRLAATDISIRSHCSPLISNGVCDLECDSKLLGIYSSWDHEDCELNPVETVSLEATIVVWARPLELKLKYSHYLNLIGMTLSARVQLLTSLDSLASPAISDDFDERLDDLRRNISAEIRIEMRPCEYCDEAWVQHKITNLESNRVLLMKDAIVRRAPIGANSNMTPIWRTMAALGSLTTLLLVLLAVVRTRKRRMVHAPLWIPPMEKSDDKTSELDRDSIYAFSNGLFHTKLFRMENELQSNVSHLIDYIGGSHTSPIPTSQLNVSTLNTTLQGQASSSRTALHWLVDCVPFDNQKSITDQIQALIDTGISIDAQDEREETALFLAVRRGLVQVAEQLLHLGANGTIMNEFNSTCLHQAVHNTDLAMLKVLLANQRIVNSEVDGRKSIDCVDREDRTALMLCAEYPYFLSLPLAKLLVQYGANPSDNGDKSSHCHQGMTVLHYAAKFNNVEMIKYISSISGVNLDAEDRQGCTPLWQATYCGHVKAVQTLLDLGANCHISDHLDQLPRDVATQKRFHDISKLLETHKRRKAQVPNFIGRTVAKVKRLSGERRSPRDVSTAETSASLGSSGNSCHVQLSPNSTENCGRTTPQSSFTSPNFADSTLIPSLIATSPHGMRTPMNFPTSPASLMYFTPQGCPQMNSSQYFHQNHSNVLFSAQV